VALDATDLELDRVPERFVAPERFELPERFEVPALERLVVGLPEPAPPGRPADVNLGAGISSSSLDELVASVPHGLHYPDTSISSSAFCA
jgi:hypothetical protein